MKKILLFLCLLLLATSCATQKTTANNAVPYVYYTGDNAPAASSGVVTYSNEQ